MAKILAVGIATIDIINTTNGYPNEDDEVRALSQSIRRGGNASNSLVVLSQLGHHCQWLGCLADDANKQIIVDDLNNYRIDFSSCEIHADGVTPTSYITLNQQNGSRTIVHYRNLPELSAISFDALPLSKFEWIHFEGRNVVQTNRMLEKISKTNPEVPVSIEIEKQRERLNELFQYGNVYFFSKNFAVSENFNSAEKLLRHYRSLIPDALLVCTWGDEGAYAMEKEILHFKPAQKINKVVETIGAGDTFNAAFIHASLEQKSVASRLEFANTLAAKKCSTQGFNGLR